MAQMHRAVRPSRPLAPARGDKDLKMKRRSDAILKSAQAEYLEKLTPKRDALLARMEDVAAKNRHPIADPEVGQMLRILVRAKKPRHILEVGTNIGYSVIMMGRECGREAVLETIEINP